MARIKHFYTRIALLSVFALAIFIFLTAKRNKGYQYSNSVLALNQLFNSASDKNENAEYETEARHYQSGKDIQVISLSSISQKARGLSSLRSLHVRGVNSSFPDISDEGVPFPHPYSAIHHPGNICAPDLDLFIYVHSMPRNYKYRMWVRGSWGNQRYFRDTKLAVLFVMGRTDEDSVQESLDLEAKQHRDILQEDFIDSYKNLTNKAKAALRFYNKHCRHVPYVLKSDDDIFLNLFPMLQELTRVPETEDSFLLCRVWLVSDVVRDKNSKWYISEDLFPEKSLPPYCSGSAFFLSSQAALRLLNVTYHVAPFWVDDLWLTGQLPPVAGVQVRSIADGYELIYSKFRKRFLKDFDRSVRTLYVSHHGDLNEMENLWRKIVNYYASSEQSKG